MDILIQGRAQRVLAEKTSNKGLRHKKDNTVV
jgi:hypothetical protein